MKVDETMSQMTAKSHESLTKEGDNERLRNQVDQLTKDLLSAIASKKAFEDETSRTRSEMRIQMDRLRNNMHELLHQGGVEAKVIESQNFQLQKELDILRDELERVNSVKEHLELEIQQLRASVSVMRDEEKANREEIFAVKEDNLDLSQKLRDLRMEVNQLTSSLTLAEQLNSELQNQLKAEIQSREELVEIKETEMESFRERARLKTNSMEVEMDIKDAEIESTNSLIVSKTSFITKLEQTYSADINRLERKLAVQVRYDQCH
jgi:chromosome segregation ATPase